MTYGGIQRAFLEKVEGEYQGAYFRMTQGLESGITHMAQQDDGSIIVGGLGAGGNWGQSGKLDFGLQKLVPNGSLTFDMQKVELADGGFKITYTKPVSDATLTDLKTKYKVRSWGYAPTEQYGGPKIGDKELTVSDATVSADKKVVTLKVAGLEPNKVVYIRSPRPFAAADGTELLSTEAWYTLNKLPGYVAPVSEGFFELEDGILAGGAKFDTEHAGFTGNGFVSGIQTAGASSVKVEANMAKAGDYRMALHYAAGPNPFAGPKKMTLIVNGTSRQITLPSTGTWKTWGYYLDTVTLTAGVNTIELKYNTGDDGNVNLDNLRLAPAGTTRYEGEAGTLDGRRERADRARRLQRPRLRRRVQQPGREHDHQGQRARRRHGGHRHRLRQRPEPVRGHQAPERLRQRRLPEEDQLHRHRRVERVPDADQQPRAEGRQQRHLLPLRQRRRGQHQPRLRRRQAERADPVRHRQPATTRSTAPRSTSAAGRRSSTRTRPATRSAAAS